MTVTLQRADSREAWGFRLAGGRDLGQPLSLSQVSKNSLAEKVGLTANDLLVSIAGQEVFNLTHEQAERAIHEAGDSFQMIIEREHVGGRKISFEKSAMTVSLKLGGGVGGSGGAEVAKLEEAFISNVPVSADTPSLLDSNASSSVNFKKFERTPADISASKTLEPQDLSKTYNRKDWNCPWVRKDGKGIKQAIRCVEEAVAPAKTSHQHFYSEPKSILASEVVLSPEELQEIIRQHGAESRPESRANLQTPTQFKEVAGQLYQQEMERELQEEIMMRRDKEVRDIREERLFQEETFTSKLTNSMTEDQETYYREREEDSQAPPDLEPVTPLPADMVGDEAGYEPSADELIDVLKNLENLAAANPGLYRSIVQQIKGSQQHYEQQTTSYYGQEEHIMNGQYEEQYEQYESYEQQQQLFEQHRIQEEEEEIYQQQQHFQQSSEVQQQEVVQQVAVVVETKEEEARRLKMERLEREANEEVRATLQRQKELKMAKLHPPEPPKPKEITVIAGDGKPVKILLGTEVQEDSRKQVAEAAGLKHVPLPDFDGDFTDSAWAGSLKRTAKSKLQQNRAEAGDGGSPWAGSLRHVPDSKNKKHNKRDEEDIYGTAPWMGTLRHVVHDNKVTKHYGVNQFQSKRYPDEDATNPFEGQGGIHARPAFPLTPAAVINGHVMSREEMSRREEEEEVQRIRSNIRGGTKSETISTALLNALMPKLLKMHESKYPAMDRDEASKIMEEILAMQVGLNVDQQADANEEAEMIIRAIMQDEVSRDVYAKMADDLEAAKQRRLKEAKKKKLVKKPKKADSVVEASA